MKKTRSAIFVFFIVLKDKEIPPGGNLQPAMAILIFILWFFYDITEKNDSNINFKQIQTI